MSPGRRAKDLGGVDLADVNAKTTLVFDVDPVQAGVDVIGRPGEEIVVPVRVSHHSVGAVQVTIAACWSAPGEPWPRDTLPAADARSDEFTVQPFQLSEAKPLKVVVPAAPARLLVWADHDGVPLGRGFLDVGYVEIPPWKSAGPAE